MTANLNPSESGSASIANVIITAGEPAGIGPDVVLAAACLPWHAQLVTVADKHLMAARARQLGLDIALVDYTQGDAIKPHAPGVLPIIHIPLSAPCDAGKLNNANANYVLATLEYAAQACLSGDFAALVTAPVHKGVINDAGVPFSGHTEFFADICNTQKVVMMLVGGGMRVALATTHLPLREVADAVTGQGLAETLRIVARDLGRKFNIAKPSIAVLGLNPHAGEGGHLGREEIDTLIPAIEGLRAEGMNLIGPLPADTAFKGPAAHCDAILAMYHDQGLPVLKYASFGEGVNITLGLPIIRTSVDHGTALELAGTGTANPNSLKAAIQLAIDCAISSRNTDLP